MAERFLNTLTGIVWSIDKYSMTILLSRGGKIQAPIVEGIHEFDRVAFTMDPHDKIVQNTIKREEADEIVKKGSNHIYAVSCRDPQEHKEDDNNGEIDTNIFGCYDIQ